MSRLSFVHRPEGGRRRLLCASLIRPGSAARSTVQALALVLGLTLGLAAAPAQANRLQVSPTLIEIAPGRPAEAIWLSNPGQVAVPI